MCCPLVFEFSVGIGGFVIGLGQISFFFSHNIYFGKRLNIICRLTCELQGYCVLCTWYKLPKFTTTFVIDLLSAEYCSI